MGFVGIGKMARAHAKAALASGATIHAACAASPNSENWHSFIQEYRCLKLGSPQAVIDASDAIIICPAWDVVQHLMPQLLVSNKPMLIEKPVAFGAMQAHKLLREALFPENKMIGFNRRFYSSVRALKVELSKRKPRSIHVVISEHLDHHREKTGEKVIPYLIPFTSVHTIDLMLFLFPSIVVRKIYRTEEKSFVSYNGLLESGGVPMFFSLNSDDPSPTGIWVRFSDEVWALSPLESLKVYKGIKIIESGSVRRYTPSLVGEIVESGIYKPGILEQMKSFLVGSYGEGAGLEDCVNQLELIDEIRGA